MAFNHIDMPVWTVFPGPTHAFTRSLSTSSMQTTVEITHTNKCSRARARAFDIHNSRIADNNAITSTHSRMAVRTCVRACVGCKRMQLRWRRRAKSQQNASGAYFLVKILCVLLTQAESVRSARGLTRSRLCVVYMRVYKTVIKRRVAVRYCTRWYSVPPVIPRWSLQFTEPYVLHWKYATAHM